MDQVLSQREIVALTSLCIAMIGYGIILAFALESLKTGEVWGVEKTYTRAKQPSRFWFHMSVYGSTLTLAGVVFGTALQELVG